ncbi:MAG TPA: winged helix-turn-helix domain-containing protein [Candidatus Nanoarchaeia archaeon]|nr:winged helix-turn-helix domain-containing protein [Candidatus Nanoarchaeia archaeon]
MAKRNRLEIIQDILKIIQENHNSIKPTPLLRQSNISTARFKEYFNDLIKKKFIKEINNKNNKSISLTDKGFKFLEKYRIITGFIEEFEL